MNEAKMERILQKKIEQAFGPIIEKAKDMIMQRQKNMKEYFKELDDARDLASSKMHHIKTEAEEWQKKIADISSLNDRTTEVNKYLDELQKIITDKIQSIKEEDFTGVVVSEKSKTDLDLNMIKDDHKKIQELIVIVKEIRSFITNLTSDMMTLNNSVKHKVAGL